VFICAPYNVLMSLCAVLTVKILCVFLVKFYHNAKIYAIIWTTTPWTLPLNQAICYASNIQ